MSNLTFSLLHRCAVSWIVESDLCGPRSARSLYLADLHDKCLKNRKQGYQLFHNHDKNVIKHKESFSNLDFPAYPSSSPHFLNATAGAGEVRSSSSASASGGAYHSTSVLGRLFDYCQGAVMASEKGYWQQQKQQQGHPLSLSLSSSRDTSMIVLDPDFNIDSINTSFNLPIEGVAGSVRASSSSSAHQGLKGRQLHPEQHPSPGITTTHNSVKKLHFLQAARDLLTR